MCVCIHTAEEAVGPASLQPTMFNGFVCLEWLCVVFRVGCSFGAPACKFLVP